MVVNAPQSNVLSAAEHTIALLLAQARNVPQANADLHGGQVEPLAVGGRRAPRQDARHRRPRPRRRARRAARARVRHAARRVRPVRERRAGPPARRAARRRRSRSSFATCRLPHRSTRRRPRRPIGLVDADRARARQARPAARQHRAGRHRRRGRARRRDPRRASSRGAALDVFAAEPTTESPLFELDTVVVTPHLGASTVRGAGQGRRQTIAEQVVLALRGDFVPFAVNVAATEASETVRPFLPLAERLGRLFTGLAGGVARHARDQLRGRDRRLRLPRAHALGPQGRARSGRRRAGVVRERAAARRGARPRRARDDVVRRARLREPGRPCAANGGTHVAATLFGKQDAPRIVGIDDHIVDLPPSRHMLVVRNEDVPGDDRHRRRRSSATRGSTSPTWTSARARGRSRAHGDRHRHAGPGRGRRGASPSSDGVVDVRDVAIDARSQPLSAATCAQAVGLGGLGGRRSSGRRGCGRSSGRRARGRCRSRASP